MSDGSERPIAFVSRSLTEVEHKYSQIKREALACVYGVKKFHNYLFAECFTLQTDRRSLMSLFNELKGVPVQASGRIQRWVLALASMNTLFLSSPQPVMVMQMQRINCPCQMSPQVPRHQQKLFVWWNAYKKLLVQPHRSRPGLDMILSSLESAVDQARLV